MATDTVQISRDEYDGLIAQSQRGEQAQKQLQSREADNVVNAAIAAGKVSPQNKDYWLREYERDPQGTFKTIAGLQAVPLSLVSEQQQHARTADEEADAALADARSFIPELRGRTITGQSKERREQRAAVVERQSLPPSSAASVPFRDGLGLTVEAAEGQQMQPEQVEAMFPEVAARKQGRAAGAWQRIRGGSR
jgi:hypothetical protein